MKNKLLIVLLLVAGFTQAINELASEDSELFTTDGLELVDEILVTIYHPEGKKIILRSYLERPTLQGKPQSLRMLVLQELMILEAEALQVQVTLEDAERFMLNLRKTTNVSLDDLKAQLRELGFTYKEALETLRRKETVDKIMDFKVRGDKQLIVDRDAIVEYYETHPEYTEEAFELVQGFVSKSALAPEELDARITSGTLDGVEWGAPFIVQEHELADDKRFIMQEKIGAIVGRDNIEDGYELTKLIDKKERELIPLDDRYDNIMMQLGKERYEKRLAEYFNELLSKASLRFTYPEDKELVFSSTIDEMV